MVKSIIEKWYKRLEFDKKYDKDFYQALNEIEIPPETTISNYDMSCEDGMKNLLVALYSCERLQRLYKEKGISDEILIDSLHDINRWLDTWSKVKGKTHLGEMSWLSRTLNGNLFKLGRLQFAFITSKHDYPDSELLKGQKVIDVHIPADGKLSEQSVKQSFNMAKEFAKKFFPMHENAPFITHSWLLDKTLEEYLSPESNTLKFAKLWTEVHKDPSFALLRFIFSWDTNENNLKDAPITNSFMQKIKQAVLDGKQFYEVLGIIRQN
ncbi:MAG: DUF5596 domain-containing protein [Clostridia bacterium]|nr:DUF5596 domain-containing protein [Clostridia bacterium]